MTEVEAPLQHVYFEQDRPFTSDTIDGADAEDAYARSSATPFDDFDAAQWEANKTGIFGVPAGRNQRCLVRRIEICHLVNISIVSAADPRDDLCRDETQFASTSYANLQERSYRSLRSSVNSLKQVCARGPPLWAC